MQKSEQICLLSLGVQNSIQKVRRGQTCSEWMLENLKTPGVLCGMFWQDCLAEALKEGRKKE